MQVQLITTLSAETNMTKTSIGFLSFAVVASVFGLVAFFGFSPFGKQVIQQIAGSPVGSTFNTAKVAASVMAPATASATSTSLLNSDASDRYILDVFANCASVGTSQTYLTGAGLTTAGWLLIVSTSSASTQTAPNANAWGLSIATTTPNSFNITGAATTTPAINRVWATGSYLQFTFNATNTASCIPGVHYLAS